MGRAQQNQLNLPVFSLIQIAEFILMMQETTVAGGNTIFPQIP